MHERWSNLFFAIEEKIEYLSQKSRLPWYERIRSIGDEATKTICHRPSFGIVGKSDE